MTTRKTKALTRRTFVSKVMSLLFTFIFYLFIFFSFYNLFIFHWWIVALQNVFVSAIHQYESAIGINIFPHS